MKNMNLKKAMKIADSKMPSKYKVRDGFSNNPNYVGDWFGEGQIDFSAIINPEDDGDVYMVKLWCGSGYILDVYLCKAHDIYEALDIVSEWSYKNEGANEIVFDYDYLLKDCERDYNSNWYGGKEPTPAEKGMDFDEFFDEWADSWLIMCENGYWVREENLFVDKVPDEYLVDNEPISDSRKIKDGKRKSWNGCANVDFVWNGEYSDPDLVAEIDGVEYTFNYYDIEDALWNDFLEYEGVTEKDTYVEGTYNIADEWNDKFAEYCRINAYDYLCDVVFGGYFDEGSTSWHDAYK